MMCRWPRTIAHVWFARKSGLRIGVRYLTTGFSNGRAPIEGRVRAALARLDRPVAAPAEVTRQRDADSARAVGLHGLRRVPEPVGQKTASLHPRPPARSRLALVSLDLEEHIAPHFGYDSWSPSTS